MPEVWGSTYDIRPGTTPLYKFGTENPSPICRLAKKIALKQALKKAEGTDLEKLLKDHGFIG